jgi:hypothetical protein
MAFVKHPVHGNKNVDDSEVAALVADGWVKWPRSPEEKALGDGSDAAYWRKKYERDVSAASPVDEDSEDAPKRRGRPPKD